MSPQEVVLDREDVNVIVQDVRDPQNVTEPQGVALPVDAQKLYQSLW